MAAKKTIAVNSHTQPSQTEVLVGSQDSSYIEGRLVLTTRSSYRTCGEASLDGIVATFVDLGEASEVRLKHRMYCSELHAAFDMLSIADGVLGAKEILDLVERSLDGESTVAEEFEQEVVDKQVESILQKSQGPRE